MSSGSRTRDTRPQGTTKEDWKDALRLAQLWSQYWTVDPIVRLDTKEAGFLARSFLAAMGEARKWEEYASALEARTEILEAARVAAEEALRLYGRHLNDCAKTQSGTHFRCTCRFDELLAAVPVEDKKPRIVRTAEGIPPEAVVDKPA